MRNNKLYYIPSLNRFADSAWIIVHDLAKIFDTWKLDEWKRSGFHGSITDRNGDVWYLYYLKEHEEDDILELVYSNNKAGALTDRVYY